MKSMGHDPTREIRRRGGSTGQVAVMGMTADAWTGSRERRLKAGQALSRWRPQAQPSPRQHYTNVTDK